MTLTVEAHAIGASGDGIGHLPDGTTAFIAGLLPGERAEIEIGRRRDGGVQASVTRLLKASSARVPPPCPHAEACGACQVQHLADAEYADWKRGLLCAALARAGFAEAPVAPLIRTPPASRRRADFALVRRGSAATVGFHARYSHAVVDTPGCLVLHPALLEAAQAIRGALPGWRFLGEEAEAVLTLLDHGVDLWLRGGRAPDAATRQALAAFGTAAGLVRIAWSAEREDPEPIATLKSPTITLGGVAVLSPAGAFLQASAEGEAAIQQAVLAGLAGLPAKARVADLFAGLGTLSLPMTARVRVLAVEGDAPAASALRAAANANGLAPRLSVETRDLVARPMFGADLKGFAAVVLDPPRDGAAAQCRALAEGVVDRVVYVSCAPAALARDAKLLAAGGFGVVSAVPIDQFPWSAHLESVVVFSRAAKPRRAR